jgi:hypothetical protein
MIAGGHSLSGDGMADVPHVVARTTAGRTKSLERRRLGRADAAPHLLPLLRSSKPIPFEPEPPDLATPDLATDDKDTLRAARGIAVALLAVIPFWCAIAFAVWFFRH